MTRALSGAVLVALIIFLVWFAPPVVFEGVAALVGVLGAWELFRLVHAAAIPMAIVYLALPLAALVQIRLLAGPEAVFLVILTVIVSDTAQYYTGRALGRRPLAPRISPKKTIEGAAGGFVVATAVFVVVGAAWAPTLGVAVRVALGIALVACGIAGDLFESFL